MIITPIIIGSGGGDPVRPADWLDISGLLSLGQKKIVGLYAVYKNSDNLVAVQVRGAYNVRVYGDIDLANQILNEDVNDNTQWNGTLNYDNFEKECSRGYRQAIIIITPQAGQNLTNFSCRRHTSYDSGRHSLNWLEVRMVGTDMMNMAEAFGNLTTHYASMLEEFHYIGKTRLRSNGGCSLHSIFIENRSIRVVEIDWSEISDCTAAFRASGMKVAPNIISNNASLDNLFLACPNLGHIPSIVITAGTPSVASLANSVLSLQTIGSIDMSSVSAATGLALNLSTHRSLKRSEIYGIKVTHSYRYNLLSFSAIVEIFTNLGNAAINAAIDVRDNSGSSSLTDAELLIAVNKGWTVLY